MKDHRITLKEYLANYKGQINEVKPIPKPKKTKNKASSMFFLNAKDILLMLLLLICSVGNFSYLNILYTFLGLSYFWLLCNNSPLSRKVKTSYEILLIIYSSVLLIIKSIFYAEQNSIFIKNNTKILLNLGFQFLRTDKEDPDNQFLFIIMTFLCDSLVLFGSIISIVINWSCNYNLHDNRNKDWLLMEMNESKSNWANHLMTIFILNFILLISCNISYMTMVLSILEQIAVILWAFNYKERLVLFSKVMYTIVSIFTCVILLSTHLINIYHISIMLGDATEYFYHFGIVIIYADDITQTYINMLYVVFVCTGFTIVSFSFQFIKSKRFYYDKEDNKNKEEEYIELKDDGNNKDNNEEQPNKENAADNNKQLTFFEMIKNPIIEYVKSSFFALHLCRIGVLLWITFYFNYYSLGLLAWLSCSFLFTQKNVILVMTVYIGLPSFLVSYLIIFIYNMPSIKQIIKSDREKLQFKLWGLQEYTHSVGEILFQQITQIIFLYLINVLLQEKSIIVPPVKQNLHLEEKEIEEIFPATKLKPKYTLFSKQHCSHSFKAIFMKFILYNIDKISLVCMYITMISSINLSHFILVICFIIQLTSTNIINKFGYVFIVIIQIIFVLEYFLHLFKLFLSADGTAGLIKFLIPFNSNNIIDIAIEPILFLAVYCFYIQYTSSKMELYKEVQDAKWTEYINYKLKSYPNVRKGFYFIIDFIIEIYLIILMGFSFWLIVYFEINMLFNIKLVLFSLNCYFIFTNIQGGSKFQNCINYCFLVYCCFNTLLVYFYQFHSLEFSSLFIEKLIKFFIPSDEFGILPILGLREYNNNLSFKFFPHFGLNLLSVLFFIENKRRSKENGIRLTFSSSQSKQRKRTTNSSKAFSSNNNDNDLGLLDSEINENLIEEDNEIKQVGYNEKSEGDNSEVKKEDVIEMRIKLKTQLQEPIQQPQLQQSSEKEPQFYYDLIIIKIIFIFYWSILHITKYYWLLLFVFVCILITTVELSLFIVLYILIFGLLFIFMFKKQISNLSSFIKKPSFYFSKEVRYHLVEIPSSDKIMKFYKQIGFYALLLSAIIFILFTYTYTLLDLFQNGCQMPQCDQEIKKFPLMSKSNEHYFQAVAYLIGAYLNLKEKTFLVGIWPHFVFLILILLDIYIQKLERFLEVKSFEQSKKLSEIKFQLIQQQLQQPDISNRFRSKELNNLNGVSEINPSSINLDATQSVLNDSVMHQRIKIIRNIDENRLNRLLGCFSNYNKSKEVCLRKQRSSAERMKIVIKKIWQEFSIALLVFTAITKLNIWSYIYMAIAIFLSMSQRTMKKYYYLMIFLVFSLVLQTTLFVSNISKETEPDPNSKPFIEILNLQLSIPWYSKYFAHSMGYFLGLGVGAFQIDLIWFEIAQILFLFIYLDLFSYGKYQDCFSKINYSNLPNKSKLLAQINKIEQEDYYKLTDILQYNFQIQLGTYNEFKTKLQKEIKPKSRIFKKKSTKNYLKWNDVLRIHFYFSMTHLTLIFLISTAIVALGLFSGLLICFSLIFLLSSPNLIKGKKSNFPDANRTLLKFLVIIDIIFQLIAQTPLQYNFENDIYRLIRVIGITRIIDFGNSKDSTDFKYDKSEWQIVNSKAIAFLLISLQEMLFNMKPFQEFYISHLFLKQQTFKKGAFVHSYFLNNQRIEEMNKANKVKVEMQVNLANIEDTVNNLKIKMNHQKESDIFGGKVEKLNLFCFNQEEKSDEMDLSQKEKNKLEIKRYMQRGILVSMYKWLHNKSVFYYLIDKNLKKEFKDLVIQGKTFIPTKVDKEIEYALLEIDLSLMNDMDMREIKAILDNKDSANKDNKNNKSIEDNMPNEKRGVCIENKSNADNDNDNEGDQMLIDNDDNNKDKEIELNDNLIIEDNKKEEEEDNIKDEDEEIISNKTNSVILQSKQKPQYQIKEDNQDQLEEREKNKEKQKIKDILSTLLYKKYLTNAYLLKNIAVSCALILFNSEYFVFFLMILNNMVNNSIMSIVYPVLAFCIGMLHYPRPTHSFWNACIAYATIVLLLKCAIQLEELNNIPGMPEIFLFLETYKFGLKQYPEYDLAFYVYILSEPILLFAIINLKQSLIHRGLWKKSEIELESIPHAHHRIFKALSDFPIERNKTKHNEGENRKGFFRSLFLKTRNEKPGIDLFFYYTTIMFAIVIYCIVNYSNMERDSIYSFLGPNQQKQYSGWMVLMALLHVLIIILDRVIYLRHNRMNPTFQYLIFDKLTGDKIVGLEESKLNPSFSPNQNPFSDQELNTISSKFKIIVIQNEPVNYPLIAKYILHIFTVLFSHIIIFFYFPMYGNYTLTNNIYCKSDKKEECNDFTHNIYLIFFYIFYSLYLLISSLQIYHGFYDIRKKSLIKQHPYYTNSIILQIIDIIPFFSEIKLVVDWTFTTTSLGLFQWNKFERIYNRFFITLCSFKFYELYKVGSESSFLAKISLGGTLLLGIMFVLVGPLFLFSSLNPINEFNNVKGATISLFLSFKNETMNNRFKLYENEHANTIELITDEMWNKSNYIISPQTKAFPQNQVQLIQMNGHSDSNFGMTQPNIDKIISMLSAVTGNHLSIIQLQLFFKFNRENSLDTDNVNLFNLNLYSNNSPYDKELLGNFTEIIKCEKTKHNTIKLENFYTPAIRLTSETKPMLITDSNNIKSKDVYLRFNFTKKDQEKVDYSKTFFSFYVNRTAIEDGLQFHVFSDKIAKSLLNYNVITFYFAWVLLLGSTLKRVFSEQEYTCLLTEMPDADQLINLCEGIKICRYSRELEKEEELYYVLMEFMRSPDYLNYVTKSSIEKFRERQAMKEHMD